MSRVDEGGFLTVDEEVYVGSLRCRTETLYHQIFIAHPQCVASFRVISQAIIPRVLPAKGGIPLFGKEGLGEIFRVMFLFIIDSLVNHFLWMRVDPMNFSHQRFFPP